LVIGGALFTGFVLLQPWGGLRRLHGLFPAVRGAFAGIVVSTVLAGVLEGVGLNVAGAAIALVLPLTVLAVLRVQHHADDRTQVMRVDPVTPAEPQPPAAAPAPADPALADPPPADARPPARPLRVAPGPPGVRYPDHAAR
jgi:hypothetical protein